MPRTTRRLRPVARLALPALLVLGVAGCGPVTGDTAAHTSTTTGTARTTQTSDPSTPTTQGGADSANSSLVSEPANLESSSGGSTAAQTRVAAGPMQRVAGITDGDTIKVWVGGRKERVRLIGVDTPESKKPGVAVACYAREATSTMQSLVQSKDVRLVADPTQTDRDRYNRLLRYVELPDGRDVAQELIAGGYGREYTYDAAYAKQSAFRSAQSQAQSAHRGLWSACTYAAAFEPPASTSAPATTTAPKAPASTGVPAAKGACVIKGNISSSGEKIYHLPGQQHYAQTVITTSKGERWFCSEQEAQAAGWRPAKA